MKTSKQIIWKYRIPYYNKGWKHQQLKWNYSGAIVIVSIIVTERELDTSSSSTYSHIPLPEVAHDIISPSQNSSIFTGTTGVCIMEILTVYAYVWK